MSDKARPEAPSSKPAKPGPTAATPVPGETFDFLSPPKNNAELGRLAHYRVLKVLGRGGMGTVFMAEDTKLHRIVALKVLLQTMARKQLARERFLREAQAAAKIEHDNIVTIYEVGAANNMPYLAMQFLKGMTLDDWLRKGKTLNVPQIMRIGKEIAKALAAAHTSGLIHRDIKPSNIWLDAANKGRVKLLDFGLARPTHEESHLTQLGTILGTPAFMSPEQARGEHVDARCDLFSLGCILYRLCASKLPFAGKDAMSMLMAILKDEPPPLRDANPEVPAKLAELVHRLLAKKPEDRPASAKDVVAAIQAVEREWILSGKTVTAVSAEKTIGVKTIDIDPALEESAITELELEQVELPTISKPARGNWFFAGCLGALLTIVSTVCCFGTLIVTNQGSVEVEAEDDKAAAILEKNELTVWDSHNKGSTLTAGTHRLPTGEYHVRALPKGLEVTPDKFTLSFTETVTLHVRYVPPKPEARRPALEFMTNDLADKMQKEWAAYLKRTVAETNSIGATMVLIPPGDFLMGTSKPMLEKLKNKDKALFPADYAKHVQSEAPQHKVRLTRPYAISATEVTIAQFRTFVAEAKHITEPESSGRGGTALEKDTWRETPPRPEYTWARPGYEPQPTTPVTNIAWSDAEAFCRWLSKKEDKLYRLPTEAEWEYACRAGSTTSWSSGEDIRGAADHMWCHFPKASGTPTQPNPIGLKKKNAFGLFDMHGNVAEMCVDFYGPGYYLATPPEDPKGPAVDSGHGRVVRGGSFLEVHQAARSAYRHGLPANFGHVHVGFRVVCEVPLAE